MLALENTYENGRIPQPSKVGIVQMTGNYKMFKINERNRPIDQRHLLRLHDAIEQKNLLREYPIVVDVNMYILDGQHRLKVAESLSIPIYYIVSDRATIADIAKTNSDTRHWKQEDYLHHFCSANKLEYLKLRRFWEKYNFLTLSLAMRLCHYGHARNPDGTNGASRLFSSGNYVADDMPHAEKVAEALLEFSRYVAFYKTPTFVHAVNSLISIEGYDQARMMKKMEFLSPKLVRCATVDLYFVVFNEIYNYKTREGFEFQLKKIGPASKHYRTDYKRAKSK